VRKGIAGLAALTQNVLRQEPASGAVMLLSKCRLRPVEVFVLGWSGLLPLLQSAGTRLFSLACYDRGGRPTDVIAACDVVGGD
jgi:hypothetical protein